MSQIRLTLFFFTTGIYYPYSCVCVSCGKKYKARDRLAQGHFRTIALDVRAVVLTVKNERKGGKNRIYFQGKNTSTGAAIRSKNRFRWSMYAHKTIKIVVTSP